MLEKPCPELSPSLLDGCLIEGENWYLGDRQRASPNQAKIPDFSSSTASVWQNHNN